MTNEVPNLDLEIMSIDDAEIRKLVEATFREVPPYFWTLPASSSGKYHPPKERAAYGLVYHTKEVFRVGHYVWEAYSDTNLDEVKAAILLHDVGRYGLGKVHAPHSLPKHPGIAADLFERVACDLDLEDKEYVPRISQAIRSHMGKWGEPSPKSELDWIVHMADNVASKYW